MNLENDLKRTLRRESPPDGFAGRVMQRIERQGEEAGQPRRRPVWWRAAAASVTLGVLLGGYTTHKVVEHRRGEKAKEQLLLAMHIAGEKVSIARDQVRGIAAHH